MSDPLMPHNYLHKTMTRDLVRHHHVKLSFPSLLSLALAKAVIYRSNAWCCSTDGTMTANASLERESAPATALRNVKIDSFLRIFLGPSRLEDDSVKLDRRGA